MTPAEVDAIYRSASAEFEAGEEVMLVTPLGLMGLIDDLRRAQTKIAEAGAYDVLHDA